jgi:endonuclease YncB( thermonuclease family)
VTLPVANPNLQDIRSDSGSDNMNNTSATAVIDRVHDGDTFMIKSGDIRSIRLKGIDAPEIGTVEGDAAAKAVQSILLPGDIVTLTQIDGQSQTELYAGRLVAMVYRSGKLMNEEIVRQGWAIPTSFLVKVPTAEAQRINNALEDAKRNKRGLWKKFPNSEFLKPLSSIDDTNTFPEIDSLENLSKIPGATRIGTMWLYVPPVQINITENNANSEFPLVRAPGSARIKTSQQEQRIEMYVVFPNAWAVNYQFRPILAQFIRSPFLPIKNEHLEDILLPTYALADDYTASEPPGDTSIKRGKFANDPDSSFLKNYDGIPGRIATNDTDSVPKTPRIKIRDRQLFCALRNMVVSTIPGKPQGMQVTFILSVYNYLPNAKKIEYLKSMGDVIKQVQYFSEMVKLKFPDGAPKDLDKLRQGIQSTTDISKSEPFKKYYRTLLIEGNQPEQDSILNWGNRLNMTPRLVPLLGDRAKNITFRLETNLLGNEQINQNIDDITALSQDVARRLLDELDPESDSGLIRAYNQLKTSTDNIVSVFTDFFNVTNNGYLASVLLNTKTLVSNRNQLSLLYGKWFDASSTSAAPGNLQPLSSLRSILLSAGTKGLDFFKEAAGRTLNDKSISKKIVDILVLKQQNRFGTKGQKVVKLHTGQMTVISAMNASYSPMVVPIEVRDHLMPSMQSFGKSDWVVSVNVQTCDSDLMRQLMDMVQRSRLSRMVQNDIDNWYLARLNAIEVGMKDSDANGFFNLIGINRVLLEDFIYENIQGKPGWFNATLRFVQSDIDISEYERLIRTNYTTLGSQKRILKNIVSNGIPAGSATGSYIKNTLDDASRQVLTGIFQGVFANSLTQKQIDDIIADGSFQKLLITNMDNPTGWDTVIKNSYRSSIIKSTNIDPVFASEDQKFNHVIPSSFTPGELRNTPTAFQTRIDYTRLLFKGIMNGEVNKRIALLTGGTDDQKRELVTLYDPTSLTGVNEAARRMSFEGVDISTSFLHGCYPDLELPIYTRDPLAISPDFFYRRDERTPNDLVQQVTDRINKQFQIAQANLKATGGGNAMPQEVISSIRAWMMWKKYSNNQDVINLVSNSKHKVTADEISAVARKINLSMPTDVEVSKFLSEQETTEYAKVPITSLVSARHLQILGEADGLNQIASAPNNSELKKRLMTIVPKAYLESNSILRQLADKVEEFNAFPELVANGTIDSFWGTVTPSVVARNFQYLMKAAQFRVNRTRSEEISGSMARSYPTVKVYFVEEDPKEWGLLDDYYAYNAIRSVQIVSSQDSASKVATIQMSNITRKLSDERATLGENMTEDQTDQEQLLQSFVLREGTTIMVKMGYSNDPDLLERVFFGKVVSVSAGETIQVMAQSFGAELTGPLYNGDKKHLGFWFSSSRAIGDALVLGMNSMDGLEHFGGRSWLDIFKLKSPDITPNLQSLSYSNPKYRLWDQFKNLLNPIKNLVDFGVYDPRLENAYLPYSGNITSAAEVLLLGNSGQAAATNPNETLHGAINDVKTIVNHTFFDWYYPAGRTMWDAMREMALYFNDYIVTVLPYNDDIMGMQRETIYIGPRNGLYKYTQRYDDNKDIAKGIFAKGATNDYALNISNPDHLLDSNQSPLPGYTPVINYHWVDSYHDIIEDNVVASAENLHNKVTIRYPGEPGEGSDQEFTVTADDNIKDGNIRHLISVQPNVDPMPFEDFIKLILKSKTTATQKTVAGATGVGIANAGGNLLVSAAARATAVTTGSALTDAIAALNAAKTASVVASASATATANEAMLASLAAVDAAAEVASAAAANAIAIEAGAVTPALTSALGTLGGTLLGLAAVAVGVGIIAGVAVVKLTPFELPAKYMVACNILANEMRKMYTGSLRIWGRPSVKPYDIVYMTDQTSLLYGPIEADTVIHDFNAESGFSTTIIPKAVISVRDETKLYHDIAMNGISGFFLDKDTPPPAPVTTLEPVITFTPSELEWKASISSYQDQDVVTALQHARNAVKLDPTNAPAKRFIERMTVTSTSGNTRSHTEYVKAVKALLDDDFNLALSTTSKALSIDPTNMDAKVMLDRLQQKRVDGKTTPPIVTQQRKTITQELFGAIANDNSLTGLGLNLAMMTGYGFMWNKSLAKIMGRDIINVVGLTCNGVPYTAGLEGAYKDSFIMNIEQKVMNGMTFGLSRDRFGMPANPQ